GVAYVDCAVNQSKYNLPRCMVTVTRLDCSMSALAFAHELGHLFAFQHDPANAPAPSRVRFVNAYGIIVPNVGGSIMAYSGNPKPFYSERGLIVQGSEF